MTTFTLQSRLGSGAEPLFFFSDNLLVAQQGRSDNGLTVTHFLSEAEASELETEDPEWAPTPNEVVVQFLTSFQELRSQVEADGDSLVQV